MFKLRFAAALHIGSSNPQVLCVRSKNSWSEFDFSVAVLTIKRHRVQSLQGSLFFVISIASEETTPC